MARAGSLEVGQELHGLVDLGKVGQVRKFFSGLWPEEEWRKNVESMPNAIKYPCVPFKRECSGCIANNQKDKPVAS